MSTDDIKPDNDLLEHTTTQSPPPNILILCTGNWSRSQTMEALVNKYYGDRCHVYSAGTHPVLFNDPRTVHILQQHNIPQQYYSTPKSIKHALEHAQIQYFDCIIAVCESAKDFCPVTLSQQAQLCIHIPIDDPAVAAKQLPVDSDPLQVYDYVYNILEDFVQTQFDNILQCIQTINNTYNDSNKLIQWKLMLPTHNNIIIQPSKSIELQDQTTDTIVNVDIPATPTPIHRGDWSLYRTASVFLNYGIRAFGGPATQIVMMRDDFIDKYHWITSTEFIHVMALYNCLPGPEATELACYWGHLATQRRLGALIAGICFVIPGFILMLGLSIIYVHVGSQNVVFDQVFRSMQPCVAAMYIRATHKLGYTAVIHNNQLDYWLLGISILSALCNILYINFFIVLGAAAILGYTTHIQNKTIRYSSTILFLSLCIMGFILYVVYTGNIPPATSIGVGVAHTANYASLFNLGLVGGSLSFGGAFSAIPFMRAEATLLGNWMTTGQFLDGLALGSILPAPLVIFATFVGYIGGTQFSNGNIGIECVCALLTTIGIFLPALLLPSILHKQLMRVIEYESLHSVFNGVTSAVIGLMYTTGLQLIQTSVGTGSDSALLSIIFMCTLIVLFVEKHKYIPVACLAASAVAGQYLLTQHS